MMRERESYLHSDEVLTIKLKDKSSLAQHKKIKKLKNTN